jgi:RNA polymerase sigma-70 factor (ECF subfamily)
VPRLRAYLELRLGARLRQQAEIDDLVQETFLAASGSLDDFEPVGPGAFAAWLCRIADHRVARLAEHHGAAKRRAPEPSLRLTQAAQRLAASAAGPATLAAARERAAGLREAVAGLDDDARRVVLMRHFEGRTLAEIAVATDHSETSVRRLLARAVRRLGARLADGEEGRR